MDAASALDTSLHPIEALRAVWRLMQRPEDTRQVFIVMRAMRGRSTLRQLHRLRATETGRAILRAQGSLLDRLQDRAALAALPDGSLGRAYLDFMTAENLSVDGLVALAQAEWRQVPGDVAVLRDRLRDLHDVGHVLTGYGRDPFGELCLLAFNFAQSGHLGMAMIAGLGWLRLGRHPKGKALRAAIVQGWRHGRAAAWLVGQDWETLLAQPIGAVRQTLNIQPPSLYAEAVA